MLKGKTDLAVLGDDFELMLQVNDKLVPVDLRVDKENEIFGLEGEVISRFREFEAVIPETQMDIRTVQLVLRREEKLVVLDPVYKDTFGLNSAVPNDYIRLDDYYLRFESRKLTIYRYTLRRRISFKRQKKNGKQSNINQSKVKTVGTVKTIVKEHIQWRNQIFRLAKSDIVKTYSGAALGWAWALIKPTIMIFVFWFAFSFGIRGGGGDVAGYPFVLWIIAGMVPWFYMSEMIQQGANAIRKYKFLVTKMKFPVSTIPTFVGLSKFSVHLCLIAITIVIYAIFGFLPDIYMLQLPVYMLLMLVFFISWALFSSLLASMSKDFLNLVKSFTTPIFWLSGIMWDVNSIGIPWLKTLLMFNPVTFIATGYRNVFIYKNWIWEQPEQLLYFGLVLVVMLTLAVWSYKKLIREIPDVL